MALKLSCPACAAVFALPDAARGKKAFCPKCGQLLVVTSGGVAKRGEVHAAAPAALRGFPWPLLTLALLLTCSASIVGYFALRHREPPHEPVVAAAEPKPKETEGKLPLTSADPALRTKPLSKPDVPPHTDVHSTPLTQELPKEKKLPVKELKKEEAKKKEPEVIPPLKVEEPRVVLKVQSGLVASVAFSPDDKRLAVGSYVPTPNYGTDTRLNSVMKQETKLWDLATETPMATLAGNGGLGSLAFTPDGKTVIAASSWWSGVPLGYIGNVHRWNLVSGQATAILTNIPMDPTFALSPDTTIIAGYSRPGANFNTRIPKYETDADGTIKLWDATTGKLKASLPGSGGHTQVAFAPDGKTLASLARPDASSQNEIKIWNVATGQSSLTIVPGTSYDGLVFANPTTVANPHWLKEAATYGLGRWNAVTGAKLPDILSADQPGTFAFSPDGKILAMSIINKGFHLWNAASGKRIATLSGDNLAVARIAFSHDGTMLAAACYDSVKLWRLSSVPEQEK